MSPIASAVHPRLPPRAAAGRGVARARAGPVPAAAHCRRALRPRGTRRRRPRVLRQAVADAPSRCLPGFCSRARAPPPGTRLPRAPQLHAPVCATRGLPGARVPCHDGSEGAGQRRGACHQRVCPLRDQCPALQSPPLVLAVLYNRLACAEVLLAHGADPLLPDAQGVTPVAWARALKHTRMEAVIEEYATSGKVRASNRYSAGDKLRALAGPDSMTARSITGRARSASVLVASLSRRLSAPFTKGRSASLQTTADGAQRRRQVR
mmetsp:Transcript_1762/g.5450  ORF Transcript_1762/g.5450 Transcript_1762/m.5450 type:complete len:265 (-) Transcript_1762:321-1115(-)